MSSACSGCVVDYFECVAKFYDKEEEAIEFLRSHGVLPRQVNCPKCAKPCGLREAQSMWRCRQSWTIGKTRKRRHCDFSVSDYKDTLLSHVNLPPWKVVLFVNHWLSTQWDHSTVVECLKVSLATSYEWRAICSQVTDHWFENQQSIGGPGTVVEVDKALIVHRERVKGRGASKVWLFGGVERDTNRRFTVQLQGPVGEWQEHSNLLPLIRRFVQPGSVVVSDRWGAYHGLKDYGYTHYVIGHSEAPAGFEVHTRNIEGLWKELGHWVKRPRVGVNFLYQDLARYLFLRSFDNRNKALHEFFVTAARLFPHLGGQRRLPRPVVEEIVEEEEEEEEDYL